MICVIMAGGKGTRIAEMNAEVPKPMIETAGKPILEWQIEALRRQGIKSFLIVIGHLGYVIRDYFGSGSKFGVEISYIEEEEPLGTAGALGRLRGSVREDFLLVNGDVVFDVDIGRLRRYHLKKQALVTILTHPNDHPQDSGLIEADSEGYVTKWMAKEDERGWHRNRVNAGIHLCSCRLLGLEQFDAERKTDLDREILKPLILKRELAAYDSPEYVKDMGTPQRFHEVERDIIAGKVAAKNLGKKQKAVFLDRDGTLNQYVGFLRDIDQLELVEGAAEAVRKINQEGYLAIVVSNQPVIARGEVSEAELGEIHKKLETLLGRQGAYLDAIYYCPHHPDKGFEGEVAELKMECDCRKPKPGLIYRAAEEYNIDLKNSWMIGDRESDILAGKAAGCKTIGLGDMEGPAPDMACPDLREAVRAILG